MKIRNNTDIDLVIYAGNPNEEEPEITKELKVGEDFDLPEDIARCGIHKKR